MGKLEKEMRGPTFLAGIQGDNSPGELKDHVAWQFHGTFWAKIFGTPAVSCSYKAASGFICPLEMDILFIYKPPIFVKFEDVQSVNFARYVA